jgi:hypothetical protein
MLSVHSSPPNLQLLHKVLHGGCGNESPRGVGCLSRHKLFGGAQQLTSALQQATSA